jgi:hypothetical protein
MLHWIIHGPPRLIPNEVEYEKALFLRWHTIKKIWSIVPKSDSISSFGINSGPEN